MLFRSFGFLAFLVSTITMKSIVLRRFFIGTPTLIMQDGKFILQNLKKVKFDMNDFLETAREKGYFDISTIKYALMEADGKISFLPKEENLPVINKDLKIKASKSELVSNVIIDGKIIKENLKNIGKSENWLKNKLKNKGYKNYNNILLLTVSLSGVIKIFEKNEIDKIKNVLE